MSKNKTVESKFLILKEYANQIFSLFNEKDLKVELIELDNKILSLDWSNPKSKDVLTNQYSTPPNKNEVEENQYWEPKINKI